MQDLFSLRSSASGVTNDSLLFSQFPRMSAHRGSGSSTNTVGSSRRQPSMLSTGPIGPQFLGHNYAAASIPASASLANYY